MVKTAFIQVCSNVYPIHTGGTRYHVVLSGYIVQICFRPNIFKNYLQDLKIVQKDAPCDSLGGQLLRQAYFTSQTFLTLS